MEVSAGANWKPLPDSIAYEGTIPLTYSIDWKDNTPTTPAPEIKCQKEEVNCNAMAIMKKASIAMEEELNLLSNSLTPEDMKKQPGHRTKRAWSLSFIADGLNYCCGVATQEKFDSLAMDSADIRERLSAINEGLQGTLQTISQQSDQMMEAERQTEKALQESNQQINFIANYTENLANKLAQEEVDNNKVFVTILQSYMDMSKKFIKLTRNMKRQEVIQSCRHHHIPISILKPEILKMDLKRLETELFKHGQDIAIPRGKISKYYQLPICDCSFTDDDKLLLHVKIPTKTRTLQWRLYELITTPFAWKGQTCMIEHNTLYMAVSGHTGASQQIRQITGAGLHLCKPYENKLCYLPRFAGDVLQGPECAIKLFQGTTVTDLTTHCPMRCHHSNLLSISDLNEDTYLLTHPKPGMAILCGSQSTPIKNELINSPGALKMKIPCNCQLVQDETIWIPHRFPCPVNSDSYTKITRILPASWTTLQSFVLNPTTDQAPPRFQNIQECINHNWSITIPHLNLTSSKNTILDIMEKIKAEEKTPKKWFSETWHNENNNIMMFWNLILSGCIIYLLFHRPQGVIPTLLTTAQAQESSPESPEKWLINHKISFYVTCTTFLIFITYLTYKITEIYIKNRPKRNTTNPQPLPVASQSIPSTEEAQNHIALDLAGNRDEASAMLEQLIEGRPIRCALSLNRLDEEAPRLPDQ